MRTENIGKQLLLLALPLMMSNLFQQLYNTVDAVIVGRYVGSQALAAVGTSGYIVTLLIYFFIGLSVGATIMVAQYWGARDQVRIHRTVHTAAALSLISGLLLMVVGIWLSPLFLSWMKVPDEVMPYAVCYLRIYFCSMIPMLIYNMGSAVIRATGDTRYILVCLIVACALNVVLDILLVAVIPMGIAGAAVATVCAQILSAVMVTVRLMRTSESHRFYPRKIHIYPAELKRILKIGAPSGIQSVVQCFSNVYVQSCFNTFGTDVMAGVTTVGKLEGFIYMPIEGYGMAASVLAGQKIGAGQHQNVRRTCKAGLLLCVATVVVIEVLIMTNAGALLSIFSKDGKVIAYGLEMLAVIIPLYFIYGMNQVFGGVIRGTGEARAPMLIVLICTCLFRVGWNSVMPLFFNDIFVIYVCYPVSWVLTWTVYLLYYKRGRWLNDNKNLNINRS